MRLWVSLVLVPVLVLAQSGDLDPSTETQKANSTNELVCTSHISVHTTNSLTCDLQRPRFNEDDEDQEDTIESITVCADWDLRLCWNGTGNNVSITAAPLVDFIITVHLRSGDVLTLTRDLRKIVKPRSPRVKSAVFHRHHNQTVVRIETPYHSDYLTAANQLFEYRVWINGPGPELKLNVTGEETLVIPNEYLTGPGTYRLKVRALPNLSFKGSWSDWSNTVQFNTSSAARPAPRLLVPVIVVVVGTLVISVVFSLCVRRKKIQRTLRSYTRPRVPATLGPLYKHVKLGFALTLEPEHFSHMNIQPIKRVQEKPSSESQATSTEPDAGQEDRDQDRDLGVDRDLDLDLDLDQDQDRDLDLDLDLDLDQDQDRDLGLGLDRDLSTSGTRTRSTSDPGCFTGESGSTLLSGGSWGDTHPTPASRSPSPSTVPRAPAGGLNLLEWAETRWGDPGYEVNGPPRPGGDPVYVTMSSFYHRKDHRDP